MRDCRVHVQPLGCRLFAGNDHIDIVAAAQAVIGHRQQCIGIGRQVDADDRGLLVRHQVKETRVLMAEAVVVLTPDMG